MTTYLKMRDVAEIQHLTTEERQILAAEGLARLRGLEAVGVGVYDGAMVPYRGRCIYEEALAGLSARQLAATRYLLRSMGSLLAAEACECVEIR